MNIKFTREYIFCPSTYDDMLYWCRTWEWFNFCSNTGSSKLFFSLLKHPNQLWSLPNVMWMETMVLLWG